MNESEREEERDIAISTDATARWTPVDLDARLESFTHTVGAASPRATVVPPDRTRTTAGERVLSELREIASEERLVVTDTILGRGGMSEVRLGKQRALGREVAVKQLHEGVDQRIARELLREARITGRLEHPNVVPLHDISLDERGRPRLVLKRIEGVTWTELMADGSATLRARFGVEDTLGWHLQTLCQVASALHYAHLRGVIHRDVKPDNVMIGDLGETYLVDWGIAVDLRPEALDAYDPRVLAGTPVYMAPEMALGERVSPQTDVYLLGATLYELLSGEPPHVAPSLHAIAMKALSSEPTLLPATVPFDLAAICHRCLRRDPGARYESTEALRRDVIRFLERRDSLELARASKKDLEVLEARAAEARDLPREQLVDDAPSMDLQRLFGACRFGFEAARRAWPDNPEAHAGLERTTRAMLEIELARGNTRGAEVLLSELDQPTDELVARVARARADEEAERKHVRALVAFRRDLDPAVGRRQRFYAVLAISLVWVGSPVLQHVLWGPGLETHLKGFVTPLIYLGIVGVVALVTRRTFFATRYNKQILAAIVAIYVGEIVLGTGQWVMGVDPVTASIEDLALRSVCIGMIAGFVDRGFLAPSLAYAVGYVVAARDPSLRYVVSAGCNFVTTATLLWLWRPRRQSSRR